MHLYCLVVQTGFYSDVIAFSPFDQMVTVPSLGISLPSGKDLDCINLI